MVTGNAVILACHLGKTSCGVPNSTCHRELLIRSLQDDTEYLKWMVTGNAVILACHLGKTSCGVPNGACYWELLTRSLQDDMRGGDIVILEITCAKYPAMLVIETL